MFFVKNTLIRYQNGLNDISWNALVVENHGLGRCINRFGDLNYYSQSAKAIATMNFLLKGTPFIYQGQELGMTNIKIDANGYSLWGGSAGGRMVATISSYGVQQYGGMKDIFKPSVAIIQYTRHQDYNKNGEPASFVTVGENDGIANYQTMKRRIDNLKAMGVPTEFHSYNGLSYGFGLEINTIAEGWLDQAVRFWENNI